MLSADERLALEAFADTVLPGRKRYPGDTAIAGVCDDFGAVEAGALHVLLDPAAGIDDGVGAMASLLDRAAADLLGDQTGRFADLDYARRRALVAELTDADTPMRDFWFLLALFSYMAYDSAPHLDTAAALVAPHSGLAAMGFSPPKANGRWGFEPFGYRRAVARLHPSTDSTGSLP